MWFLPLSVTLYIRRSNRALKDDLNPLITKDIQLPAFLYFPQFWAILSILFINFGCQVVFHVSHISNLVLNH